MSQREHHRPSYLGRKGWTCEERMKSLSAHLMLRGCCFSTLFLLPSTRQGMCCHFTFQERELNLDPDSSQTFLFQWAFSAVQFKKTLIIPQGTILLWSWQAHKITIHKLREQYNKHNTTNKSLTLTIWLKQLKYHTQQLKKIPHTHTVAHTMAQSNTHTCLVTDFVLLCFGVIVTFPWRVMCKQ